MLISQMINKKLETIPASSKPKHVDVTNSHINLLHDLHPVRCYHGTTFQFSFQLPLVHHHLNFRNFSVLEKYLNVCWQISIRYNVVYGEAPRKILQIDYIS